MDALQDHPPPASITTHSLLRLRKPPSSLEDDQIAQLNNKVDNFIASIHQEMHQYKQETTNYLATSTATLESILRKGIKKVNESVTTQLQSFNCTQSQQSSTTPPSYPSPSAPPPPVVPTPPSPPSPQKDHSPPCNAPDPPSAHNTPIKQVTIHQQPTVHLSSPAHQLHEQFQPYKPPQTHHQVVPPPGIVHPSHLLYSDKEQSLKFSVFNQSKTSYHQFQALYLLDAKIFDPSSTMVYRDSKGILQFNRNMSMRESEILFLATIKAFKDKVHEIIGDIDLAATNGFSLWMALDHHYLTIDKSSLEICGQRKQYDVNNYCSERGGCKQPHL